MSGDWSYEELVSKLRAKAQALEDEAELLRRAADEIEAEFC
jgi:hypothetical protein